VETCFSFNKRVKPQQQANADEAMKTVLLTGATGFIGHHCIVPLLKRGYAVHGVVSKSEHIKQTGVIWHEANLLDHTVLPNLIKTVRPSHLLHLAWNVAPGKWANSDLNFSWVHASMELLKQFHKEGGQRVAMAGSCYEYDWNYGYCTERYTPLGQTSSYGSCKTALRIMMEEYARLHKISSVWPRIFFVYGPYEHPERLISSVICSLLRKEEAKCTDGQQMRDYMFVQDVADAVVAVLDSVVTGPVNIGSGQPISVSEFVGLVGKLLQREEYIRLGALPSRPSDLPLVLADVTRLKTEVGWKPSVSREEGLKRTIRWWKEQIV
jgi:nucleoside-diphosphate-sugar epimerase